jgi:UDP-N-acetylmuramate dehydrogenase
MSFELKNNVPLAELTTFKIGGKARFFVCAKTERDVFNAFKYAESRNLDVFILGGGSNVLISDDGFDGLVLQIGLKGIKRNENFVTAQAGEDWDNFVAYCVENNLAGIECLSGIPGFVGGTPVQNVGAYGQEVFETIESVRCLDRETCEIIELENNECGFAYRTSIFNTIAKNRYIVLSVTYNLKPNGEPKITYADLQKYFGNRTPTLPETRQAILEIRAAKSMVINENDVNSRSAGSFFKNPIVSNEKFTEMCKNFGDMIPNYKYNGEKVKIPAAWLIEKSGFNKGYRLGKVGLSSKHTLALVNYENGTAADIVQLKNEIQAKVAERFLVELQPEPIFVGKF